ncbi:M1 family aminopeptidase [Pigmentibacter sp. JX0631]|uniref:M1 family metallopeptidase n=1 Tax=Pigmentibacter sp. JX0631 TaxID=2976982 RepID=UPI00246937B2|nr:M1 family aminopeptidase [Pigmentibacter sp. JX0631]WGL60261.1 M1 family aminopeptidase [Pigmentibacter sp. JX0631]
MIIGSHLQKVFEFNKVIEENTIGFQNFPAKSKIKRIYNVSRLAEQKHMYLNVVIDFENNSLFGDCYLVFETKAENLTKFNIDAYEMQINSVSFCNIIFEDLFNLENKKIPDFRKIETLKYQKCDYSADSSKINLEIPKNIKKDTYFILKINYKIQDPNAGFYFVHANKKSHANYDCVWTQGQDSDSPYWFPCQDDPRLKITTTLQFSFPSQWNALANGLKISEKIHEKYKVQIWEMSTQHSPYLVAFVAGNMAFSKDEWRNKEISLLLPFKYENMKTEILSETKEMLEFYSNYWNYEFAWDKYGQAFVADFLYGGMENTSITINTDEVLGPKLFANGNERRTYLVMHEMAHQWFGDLLTCKTWSEGWLNEGFATQSEMLWDEYTNGKVSGIFYAHDNYLAGYLGEAKSYIRPIVCNQYEFVSEIFDAHLYEKGALFLNYLRDILGENEFKNSIHYYLTHNAFKAVETKDLINAIQTVTGIDPTIHFDNFIFRAGHPDLDVSCEFSKYDTSIININISQKQNISKEFPEFYLETNIYLKYSSEKEEIIKIIIDDKNKKISIPLKEKLSFCIFDPNGTIIGEVNQKIPESFISEIFKQQNSKYSYFKFLATKNICLYYNNKENFSHIEKWLKSEESFRVRSSSYKILSEEGRIHGANLLTILNDTHPLSKAALISAQANSSQIKQINLLDKLVIIAENEKETLNCRETAIRSIQQISQKSSLLRSDDNRKKIINFAFSFLSKPSFNGILEQAALNLIAEFCEPEHLKLIQPFCEKISQHWRINIGALTVLSKLSSKYPNIRSELRPSLIYFAEALFPIRIASALPDIWANSLDPYYDAQFRKFYQRKNYGILSMLIPRSRRSYQKFLKNLDTKSYFEKVLEINELKEKYQKIQHELTEIKLVLEKLKPIAPKKKHLKSKAKSK